MNIKLRGHSRFQIAVTWLCLLLQLSGCATGNQDRSTAFTKQGSEEAQIGDQIHEQILASFRPYTEPEALEYINQVGGHLASHAERRDLDYRFVVLYSDKIYATSSPGGYVYLTTGMVHFLDNEAELAAVLAHEIAELQYKDPRLSKSKKIMDSVLAGSSAVAPAFGQIGALALLGIAMVRVASDSKNQPMMPERKLSEADQKAMGYMVQAGYDPQGLIDLQHKMLGAGSSVVPYFYDYYQSRPITLERMKRLEKSFEKLPIQNKTFTVNREGFLEKMKGVREIYVGPNAQQA